MKTLKLMDGRSVSKMCPADLYSHIYDYQQIVHEHNEFILSHPKILRAPHEYIDRIANIKNDIKIISHNIRLFRNVKMDSSVCKMLNCTKKEVDTIIQHLRPYEECTAPVRKFRDAIKVFTNETGVVYEYLMSAYSLYCSLDEIRFRATELCRKARSSNPEVIWFDEAISMRRLILSSIDQLSSIGKLCVHDPVLSHMIYEVLIYELKMIVIKLERYIEPTDLRKSGQY